ncbi:MAG: glutamate 5-kinase [Phycisphaerae bacterium]|nr:glutamate 5-kinase [Phycisphaerae bacterium]MDW8263058.1 glutamate 5-kinase [Phycisphaerales bacterium]
MMNQDRLQYLRDVRHIVIKLGTALLGDPQGRLDTSFLASMARQVRDLRMAGRQATLVSSGAVGAGLKELGLSRRPRDLAMLQAVAAVGQRKLMDAWADAFAPFELPVAQILLTREDIDSRLRFLNLRNTIHAVHDLGAIPIINENDTISTDELAQITFGDNDVLAALVCQALRAEVLILLSVVDGLSDGSGVPLRFVEKVEQAEPHVRGEKTPEGKGGMSSKLVAGRIVTGAGEVMIVANGRTENVLSRLLSGEPLGTFFAPRGGRRSGRGRWIGAARPAGVLVVDAGAATAVAQKNRSLLPAGVTRVEGDFARGDVVTIATVEGLAIARGLTNYSSAEIERIRGRKSAEIRQILGHSAYEEVVHRDNLVVL